MFCSSCGKKITTGSNFCKYCGSSQSKIIKKKIDKKEFETVWNCDFCEQEFKTKKESDKHELKCNRNPKNQKFPFIIDPKRAWEIFWLTTLLTFFATLLIVIRFTKFDITLLCGNVLLALFLINICLGIFAFLAIFARYKQNKNQISFLTKNIIIICLIYLMTNSFVFAVEGYKSKTNEEYKNKYYVTQPPVSAPTPFPTIAISPSPTVKPVLKKITTTETDPVIDCESSSSNCNGSTIKVRKSQCSKITCCQIGNSWSVYPSDEKCDEAQKGKQAPTTTVKTAQQSSGNNFYCWNNAYGYAYYTSSGDQCNSDNSKVSSYKSCNDAQKTKVEICNSACKTQEENDMTTCKQQYYNSNTNEYGNCLNGTGGVTDKYGVCLGKCTNQYSEDLKQCSI